MFGLKINNFRAFDNTYLELGKNNILIGENSGGKTSLIKLLLLLKQSMETPNKDKKINANGHILDLGNFDTFINKNSSEKSFQLSFNINSEDYINYYMQYIPIKESESLSDIVEKCNKFINDKVELTFNFFEEDNAFFTNNINISSENIGSLNFNIKLEENHFSTMIDIPAEIIINHKQHGKIKIDNKLQVYGFMLFADPDNIMKYANDYKVENFFNEIAFLLLTQNYIANILHNIQYINPINFNPTRIMLERDRVFNGRINNFEGLIDALSFLIGSKEPESVAIINDFNNAIQELGIADKIKLEISSSMPVSQLKVKKAGIWNSIVDVGYGVGLQVPILLQAVICNHNKSIQTLIIEQPEIHLHPALHAKFIDVLIKYSGNTKLIIETHSEHIIRKLQILAKNKIVDIQDTNIYYFKNKVGTFEISKHIISKDGNLTPPFPKGFYDNSYQLSKELY